MIEGRDSSQPPSLEQLLAARAAGVRVWGGYAATRPGVNLLRPWTAAECWQVRAAGLGLLLFVSGWDDPRAVGYLARSLGGVPCLDVEDGIRPDGPWVPDFLVAGACGLYGGQQVHIGRRAPFYVAGVYPSAGNPGGEDWPRSWARPPGPCGWQWAGSHQEFGLEVDSSWLDDDFMSILEVETMSPEFKRAFAILAGLLATGAYPSEADVESWAGRLDDQGTGAEVLLQTLRSAPPGGVGTFEIERLAQALAAGVGEHKHVPGGLEPPPGP